MALYIRDREVDALAARLQALTNAPTKTEAVRKALENEIERKKTKVPLRERLEKIIERADRLGPSDPDFDQKKFFDEMWGD